MGNRITEKCGIFGVYGAGFQAARLVHPGLWALQHRDQKSSGIASSDGKKTAIHKGMGLGDSIDIHAQPILEEVDFSLA